MLSRLLHHHPWRQVVVAFCLAIGISVVGYAGTTSPIDSYAACVEAGYTVYETNPPVCRAGIQSFIGATVPQSPESIPLASVQYEILVDGDTHAATPQHSQVFINSPDEWHDYWQTVHSSLPTTPPLIPVDFYRSSVVAVSLGPQLTSGYGLKITDITTGNTGSTVSMTESTPTITCPVIPIRTNRYLIVKTAKLIAPVNFRITSDRRHCS